MSALSFFHCVCQRFDSLIIHKVYACVRAHSLGERKTLFVSVYRADIFNAHCTENCDTDKTDRSASLYDYSAVEFQDACCFCSLYRVYQNGAGLDEDSGIQIQVAYIEESGTEFSASDEYVISEPAVEFYVVVRKKSVNVGAAYVFLIEIEHGDLRIILEDHAGNDFIADLHRFSCCVDFYVLAHCDDLAGSFMAQNYRDQSERIVFVFMSVRSADTAAFDFNKDIVVSHFRKRIFLKLEVLFLGHHSDSCGFRDSG